METIRLEKFGSMDPNDEPTALANSGPRKRGEYDNKVPNYEDIDFHIEPTNEEEEENYKGHFVNWENETIDEPFVSNEELKESFTEQEDSWLDEIENKFLDPIVTDDHVKNEIIEEVFPEMKQETPIQPSVEGEKKN